VRPIKLQGFNLSKRGGNGDSVSSGRGKWCNLVRNGETGRESDQFSREKEGSAMDQISIGQRMEVMEEGEGRKRKRERIAPPPASGN